MFNKVFYLDFLFLFLQHFQSCKITECLIRYITNFISFEYSIIENEFVN